MHFGGKVINLPYPQTARRFPEIFSNSKRTFPVAKLF